MINRRRRVRERAIKNKLKETCERECVLNRGKDDMDLCGCRDYDVAVFGGKKFSLCFEF